MFAGRLIRDRNHRNILFEKARTRSRDASARRPCTQGGSNSLAQGVIKKAGHFDLSRGEPPAGKRAIYIRLLTKRTFRSLSLRESATLGVAIITAAPYSASVRTVRTPLSILKWARRPYSTPRITTLCQPYSGSLPKRTVFLQIRSAC